MAGQPMEIGVCHADRAKNNQVGRLKRHGGVRQRNDPFLCLFFQLGILFHLRFVVKGKTPDFEKGSEGVKEWMEQIIFHQEGDFSKGFSNSYGNKLLERCYNVIDPPIKGYHISHLSRKSKAQEADLDDIPANQSERHGDWRQTQAMFKAYIINMPMMIIRWIGGHSKERGLYHVPRANVEPPQELVDRVFPFLGDIKRLQEENYEQWRHECTEFIEFIAKVLLQDVAVVYNELSGSILAHDPFDKDEFQQYRQVRKMPCIRESLTARICIYMRMMMCLHA